MAATEDLQAQADILNQMTEAMARLNEVMGPVADNSQRMTEALTGMADKMPDMDDQVSKMQEMNEAMEEGGDQTNNMTDAMKKLTGKQKKHNKDVKKGTKGLKKFAAAGAGLAFMKGIWDSMAAGLKSVLNLVGATITAGKNLVTGVFKAWANTWSTLGKMGKEMEKGANEIAKAYEEIRGEFGDLATGEGKMVVDQFKEMRTQGEFTKMTGLGLYKTFGDMGAQMKVVNELAKGMGMHFKEVAENFKGSFGHLMVLNKGLSISADAMKGFNDMAKAAGQSGEEATNEYAQMAVGLKKKLGINLRNTGKIFSELAKDTTNFGHLTQKELLSTAAYADKLKISVESLKGVFDKFSNFEDAAAGAANLAAQFGMNVDAMELMNAESPAEQMDMMRQAFAESGQSVQDLNRHQKAYLAETMGIKPEDLSNVFDPSNMDINYDDMLEQAEEAKKEVSPAEAMREAAKEIKKVMGQMTQESTTFFGRFKEGFLHGLKHTEPYRAFFKALNRALRDVFNIGKNLAKQLFGRGGVFHGDSMGFVAKWKDYLKEIVAWFQRLSNNIVKFAQDLKSGKDPSEAVQGFLDRLMESTEKFFNSDAVVAWQKMWAKFVKVASKIVERILVGIIQWIADKLANIAQSMGDDNGVVSAWGEAFAQLWESLKAVMVELWKILGPPLLEGIQKLWEWAKPHLIKISMVMLKIAITRAILAAAAGALAGAALKGIISLFTGFMGKATAGMGGVGKMMMGGPAAVLETNATAMAATGAKATWGAALAKMLVIAAFVAVGVVGFMTAFYVLLEMVKGRDPKEVLMAAVSMVAIGVALAGLGAAGRAAEQVTLKGLAKLALMYVMFVAAMYGLGQISLVMIDVVNSAADKLPDIGTSLKFFQFMGLNMLAGAAALAIAVIASKFAKPQTILGLGILGLAMIAMGGVAWVIAKMFESINPQTLTSVGPVLEGLASLMWVVMAAIPVAAALGFLLMSFPFGTAGVAVIAAGFGVLGTLAGVMVASLMPTIKQIAAIQIEDPASFKLIADAIASILTAVSNMMGNIAAVMEAADPGLAGMLDSGSSSMADNLKAMDGVIDSVLEPVVEIIEMLVDLAKGANISKNNVDAILAIAGVINAIANVMKALTPSPKMLEIIQASNDFWLGGRKKKTMDAMLASQDRTQEFALSFMDKASVMIVDMLKEAAKIKSPEAAKALKAVAEILNVVVNILNAIKPDEKQMKLAESANKFWTGGRAQKTLRMMNEQMAMQMNLVVPIMNAMGGAVKKIFEGLKPVIAVIAGATVDPKIYEALAKIIAAIMGAVGKMMQGIGPAMTAMSSALEDNSGPFPWSDPEGPSKAEQMGTMMGNFGTVFDTIGSSMGAMVQSMTGVVQTVINAAQTMPDPKNIGPKLEAMAKVMEIVGAQLGALPPIMAMIKEHFGTNSNWHNEVTWYFGGGTHFKGKGLFGIVMESAAGGLKLITETMVTATSGIADPAAFKAKIEGVAAVMKTVGETIGLIPTVMTMLAEHKNANNTWAKEVAWYFGGKYTGEDGKNYWYWGGKGLIGVIMEGAAQGIKQLMDTILEITKGIEDPTKAKSQMEVVASAMAMIGTMMGNMSKAMGMLEKMKGVTWTDSVKILFDPKTGMLIKMFKSMGAGLRYFMRRIAWIVKGIDNPKKAKQQIEVIVTALQAVSEMTTALGAMMRMMPQGTTLADGDALYDMMTNVNQLMEDAGWVMGNVVRRIIDFVKPKDGKGLTDVYKYRHTIATLPKVFEAVTAFAQSLQALSGVGGGDFTKVKTYMKKFSDVFSDEETIKNFKKGMTSLATLPIYTYKNTQKSVSSFATMVDESLIPLGRAIHKWYGSPGDQYQYKAMAQVLKGNENDPEQIGFFGLLKVLGKAPRAPKLDNLIKSVYTLMAGIYWALIPMGLAVDKWYWSDRGDLRELSTWISGSGSEWGLADLIDTINDMPAAKGFQKSFRTTKLLSAFMTKILLPFALSLGVATRLLGVKPGSKWWEKSTIAGGTIDVKSLAKGLGHIFDGFIRFERYSGMSPSDLDGAVGTIWAYADRFAAIGHSMDRMRMALYATVKFAKMKVTPEKIVSAAAKNIEALNEAFQSLDELVVDSTMAKVAEALVAGETVQVDHKGLSIKMKVVVNIEPRELATSLSDQHGAYFMVNENRTDNGLFDQEYN